MPRISSPLTNVEIKSAKPRTKAFKLSDGGGLYLEVLPTGGKSWRFKYRFTGQEKRLVFGLWPDVSLKQARQRRDEARALVADGVDPGEKKKQDAAVESEAQTVKAATFEVVAREWHGKQTKVWSVQHALSIIRRMEAYLFPLIGGRPITELGPPAILEALRVPENLDMNQTAKLLRQDCEAVFAYAIATGRAERNVGADLRGALAPARSKNRPAITDSKGVAGLLRAIEGYYGQPTTKAALKLLAYTFTRPGEMRHMEWSEIDLDADSGPLWAIPAGKMKKGREHVVPLCKQAVELLRGLHLLTGQFKYVFSVKPIGETTLNNAIRRMGFTGDEMCSHGFRAMASTLLHEQGWPSYLIEHQLAHVERNRVKSAYCRAEYLPERRKMMQAWADYLDALKAGAKVTPIHREQVAGA